MIPSAPKNGRPRLIMGVIHGRPMNGTLAACSRQGSGPIPTLGRQGPSLPDHAGQFYQDCLRIIHQTMRPEAYLEIGTLNGDTLALAKCAAIAIDPCFQVNQAIMGQKSSLFMFQTTSDEFFRSNRASAILGRPLDMAFLDGMHLFEYLLRDFSNTERCCATSSIIVLHDCIPLDLHMAVRAADDTTARSLSRYPLWWTGDVWKFVCILRKYRPDLIIDAFNAPPTGLILVSNLDPDSRALETHYDEIVSQFTDLPDELASFTKYITTLTVTDTQDLKRIVRERCPRVGIADTDLTMTGPIIRASRLATILDDGLTSEQALSAGISEPLLIAPAGSYTRVPPVFTDTDRATVSTRQLFDNYTHVLRQSYGDIHCVALSDATVVGQGSVITTNNLLLRESASEFLAHDRVPDGLQSAGEARWQLGIDPARIIDTPCLLVKRPWFRNFGHWLIDSATLLAVMGDDVRRYGWSIVIGANEHPVMRRIVSETIDWLVPGTPVLEHPDGEAWQFADLRYVMPLHIPPQFKLPAAIQRLRSLILERPEVPPGTVRSQSRRVYLSRRDTGVRTVVNEGELEALLACFGFETVFLHGLSLSEQARLFSEAEAVVGIKGAALANIVFCPAHCSVMVLSPSDFPDPFFWDIAGQLSLNYAELFGPVTTNRSPGRNDFVVDLVAVARMLGAVLGCAGDLRSPFSNSATSYVNYPTVSHLTESATATT